jgi:serine/threonine protein phosphatase 1
MMKISKIDRCLRLAKNTRGRDLVVGDLHGHRCLFENELERLEFDPSRDRVLSVGDLIDRGPESLATLALIAEPWFFAVLGNHELMLLNYLGYYASRTHSRKSYPTGSGEWIDAAFSKHRKALARLADRVAALPLAIHVEDDTPFNVTHAGLNPAGSGRGGLFDRKTIDIHKAEVITSYRGNVGAALKSDRLALQFARHSVHLSPTPLADLPLTYAGHSPLRHVTVHNSHVYIDQGVCAGSSRRSAAVPPTVLDHRLFAYWLGGAASASGRAAAAADRPGFRPSVFGASVALA